MYYTLRTDYAYFSQTINHKQTKQVLNEVDLQKIQKVNKDSADKQPENRSNKKPVEQDLNNQDYNC